MQSTNPESREMQSQSYKQTLLKCLHALAGNQSYTSDSSSTMPKNILKMVLYKAPKS